MKGIHTPTGLKVKNMHNFAIFQLIWLKISVDSQSKTLNEDSIIIILSNYSFKLSDLFIR